MKMTAAEFLKLHPAKPNKFGAQRTTLDGIKFDSKAEATYYSTLKLRERAGEVHSVEIQRPFALTINGYLIGTYKADFCFWDVLEDRYRVIDVKGVATPVFKLKAKMVKALYGFDVEVVQ